MKELLKNVNPERQTLLFSATLPKKLESFSKLALKKPLRVSIGKEMQTAEGITQDIIILKDDQVREAVLVYLIKKSEKEKVDYN